jgi:uncharacterized protein (DUF1697 family)
MNTYVALFRGINVGGNNLLPMKELAAVLEDLGLKEVRTYIQSGNVVFRAEAEDKRELGRDIGVAIGKSHGFVPKVLILSIQDFRDAVVSNPFPEGEGEPKSLHLFFLESPPASPDLERLASLKSESERYMLLGGVFYLLAPEGIARSRLASNAEKALGVTVTARNWRSANAILGLALRGTP